MNAFIISVGLFQQMLVGKSHEIPDVFGLNPQIKPIYILLFEFHTHPFIVCKSDVMSLEHPFIILIVSHQLST
jgi:hypothetical protein